MDDSNRAQLVERYGVKFWSTTESFSPEEN